MQVKPVASPHQVGADIKPSSIANKEAKARAVQAFKAQDAPQAQPQPQGVVPNQNQVLPEDMSALNLQTQAPEAQVEQGQPDNIEAPVETKPAEDQKLANQYAILARRERQLRAKQQQLEQSINAKEEAIKARELQIQAKEQEYRDGYISKARLKSETLLALEESNVSYDDLTAQIINTPQSDPRVQAYMKKLEAKIQQLEEATASTKQSYIDQQNQQYEAAKNQIRRDVKQLVATDPEFETIRNTGEHEEVVKLIEMTWEQDGIVLDTDEATRLVEKELEERMFSVLNKTQKLKNRLQPNTSKQAVPQSQTQTPNTKQQQPTMKTLTNATSSTRPLSAKERAILAFKGQLKS